MLTENNINLERPIVFGKQTISCITLRPPTLKDLNDIGVTAETVSSAGGWWYRHIHWDRLGELIQRCIVSPADAPAWIGQVSYADTYKLVETISRLYAATQTAAANFRGISINPKDGAS